MLCTQNRQSKLFQSRVYQGIGPPLKLQDWVINAIIETDSITKAGHMIKIEVIIETVRISEVGITL